MERQSDRQDDVEHPDGVLQVKKMCDRRKRSVEEIKIFKYKQDETGGNDTNYEEYFSSFSDRLFYVDAGTVIYEDSDKQDEYIDRNECHIKDAAGC